MNVCVFDTETTSLQKPFCYNIGYVILDTETRIPLVEKDFVIEQVWHNLPLFESAYYKEKRPLYIKAMRAHKTRMDKWGYVMREMAKDLKKFEVEYAYAYNSPFDDEVFNFNCDWFKTLNPLEEIPILDIRGLANNFITNTTQYTDFCETYERFTETKNYSATAETVYQYITENPNFEEAHTALNDSQIESKILMYCVDCGAELGKEYPVVKILTRPKKFSVTIKIDNQVLFTGECTKKYIKNNLYSFKTR